MDGTVLKKSVRHGRTLVNVAFIQDRVGAPRSPTRSPQVQVKRRDESVDLVTLQRGILGARQPFGRQNTDKHKLQQT